MNTTIFKHIHFNSTIKADKGEHGTYVELDNDLLISFYDHGKIVELIDKLTEVALDKSEWPETLWDRIKELEAVNLVLEDKLKREGGNATDG